MHRCPECGTPFDPRDQSTFLSEDELNWPRIVIPALILFLVFILLAMIFTARSEGWRMLYLAVLVGMDLMAIGIVFWQSRTHRR